MPGSLRSEQRVHPRVAPRAPIGRRGIVFTGRKVALGQTLIPGSPAHGFRGFGGSTHTNRVPWSRNTMQAPWLERPTWARRESPWTRLKRGAGEIYSLRRFGQRCFVVAYTMQADQVPVGAIGATFIHPLELPDLLAPLRPSPSRCPWVNRACVLPGRAGQLQTIYLFTDLV